MLQRALEISKLYTKAVFFLAQILINDKEHKAAIKLLEKTVSSRTLENDGLSADIEQSRSSRMKTNEDGYSKLVLVGCRDGHGLS